MNRQSTDKARHLVLRAQAGERLPDALLSALREEVVMCGFLHASGVLADVELRTYDANAGGLGAARRIAGPLHVLSLEGSIGLSSGDISIGLRALFARETDRGMDTLAGEIVAARVVALEAHVVALDDIPTARALDDAAGVWVLGEPSEAPQISAGTLARATSAIQTGTPMPKRPTRTQETDDSPVPDVGDFVDHFAFGPCDVLKSDGDRLHLRVHKDGRVKEIALEMLRVTPLDESPDPARRAFRLARKM